MEEEEGGRRKEVRRRTRIAKPRAAIAKREGLEGREHRVAEDVKMPLWGGKAGRDRPTEKKTEKTKIK